MKHSKMMVSTERVGVIDVLKRFFADKEASLNKKVLFIVAALYIVMPIDVIPEAIFGLFGLVDDLGAFAILFKIYQEARQVYSTQQPLKHE